MTSIENKNLPLVQARNLTKRFGDSIAVDHIEFDVFPGEIVGFLGPNGAGKTTTIRMLLNILNPSEGELRLFGLTFDHHRSNILKQMNASSGTLTLPGKLSTLQNLLVFSDMYGLRNPKKRIEILLQKFDLEELKNRPLYSLSTGQQVRVSLAKAFLNRPRLLLLDEPTASLDPDVADRVRTFLIDIVKEEGTTVFLTSHNMNEVEKVCTRVLFLNNGKIEAEGSPDELAGRLTTSILFLSLKKPLSVMPDLGFVFANSPELNGKDVRIELKHASLAPFLSALIKQGIEIENISIQEPTLEDFFVHSTRKGTES